MIRAPQTWSTDSEAWSQVGEIEFLVKMDTGESMGFDLHKAGFREWRMRAFGKQSRRFAGYFKKGFQ